jgi:hypothetical protein
MGRRGGDRGKKGGGNPRFAADRKVDKKIYEQKNVIGRELRNAGILVTKGTLTKKVRMVDP